MTIDRKMSHFVTGIAAYNLIDRLIRNHSKKRYSFRKLGICSVGISARARENLLVGKRCFI